MFIGHFAAGFAAKKIAPHVSLGTLFLAVQFVDLLWPIFLLLGLEHVRIDPGNTAVTPLDFVAYPLTHSLLGGFVWGVVFGGVYFLRRRERRAAFLLGLGVLSHWFLDFIVHRPDLPIIPGRAKFGLGLWNNIAATAMLELGIFLAALLWYLRTTKAKDKIGTFAFWGLVAFLVLIQIANYGGTPPPNEQAIAYVGLLQWLLIFWGYWIDRHRAVVVKAASA